jgi:hypothetical protein
MGAATLTSTMRRSLTFLLLAGALLAAGCGKGGVRRANEASVDELNRYLSAMIMHGGGKLPGTNEISQFLAAAGKTFPTPPPGKKIVLDAAAKMFVIQDQ